MARDVRVSFKMAEHKKDELEKFADSFGVTQSALCALIIGQWLHQQNNVINPMIQELTAVLGQQLLNNDDDLLAMIKEQNRS